MNYIFIGQRKKSGKFSGPSALLSQAQIFHPEYDPDLHWTVLSRQRIDLVGV
ncbi:hypothetical protein AAKU64_004398 [Undibacterium sp. GrIS 1.8]|uniref:hypothetical protein n=1 Tax=unclassified Undibacterium TaxID=2630295 RepID=UPI003395183E